MGADKKTSADLLSLALSALPRLPAGIASSFETGDRGQAIGNIVHYLILQRVPGLDVSKELSAAEQRLQATFKGHVATGEEATYAKADINAVKVCIEQHLGAPSDSPPLHTIDTIRETAKAKHYPNLEALGLKFSESHPKPFRSSLIIPMLLQRLEGLDANGLVTDAAEKLRAGYINVPKGDGTRVQEAEAATITRIAREKTEAAITELLGPQIKH